MNPHWSKWLVVGQTNYPQTSCLKDREVESVCPTSQTFSSLQPLYFSILPMADFKRLQGEKEWRRAKLITLGTVAPRVLCWGHF